MPRRAYNEAGLAARLGWLSNSLGRLSTNSASIGALSNPRSGGFFGFTRKNEKRCLSPEGASSFFKPRSIFESERSRRFATASRFCQPRRLALSNFSGSPKMQSIFGVNLAGTKRTFSLQSKGNLPGIHPGAKCRDGHITKLGRQPAWGTVSFKRNTGYGLSGCPDRMLGYTS